MTNEGILSGEEIERLFNDMVLNSAKTSGMRKEKSGLRVYDFRSPNKLFKEHARTLQMIHENFARRAGTAFSGLLHTPATVKFRGVRESSQKAYMESLSEPINLVLFTMFPLEGKGVVEVKSSLVLWLIDKAYGGKGNRTFPEVETTSLQQEILLRMMDRIFRPFRDAWAEIVPGIQVAGDTVEIKPRLAQFWMDNEVILVLDFELEVEEFRADFKICLPYSMLEPIAPKLSSVLVIGAKPGKDDKKRMVTHLEGIELPIHAILGEIKLRMRDILDLEVNDVILTDRRVGDEIPLKIGKSLKFTGHLALIDGKMAIQIEKRVEER